MIESDSSPSPHYFAVANQESPDFRSDDPITTTVTIRLGPMLKFRTPTHHHAAKR